MRPEDLRKAVEAGVATGTPGTRTIPVPEIGSLLWPPAPKSISDPAELRAEILRFHAQQGWFCWQSEVSCFRNQGELDYPDDAMLLYGELAKADASLHIREDGSGGWILTLFEEQGGRQYVMEEKILLGEKAHAPSQLLYRVYWDCFEKDGYRPFAARFKGFA